MSFKALFRLKAILILVLIIIANLSYAQTDSKKPNGTDSGPLLKLLGNFTISGSIGYGATFHKHEIIGVGLIKNPNQTPLLFDNTLVYTDTIPSAFDDWIGNPNVFQNVPIDSTSFLLGTDSVPVTFRALGTNIPISISIQYNFDRYRIGGGFSFEPYIVGSYRPDVFEDEIGTFKTNFVASNYTRWFIHVGGEVFQTKRYTVVIDAKIGSYKQQKKHFNPDIIKKSIFFNFGARFEYSLSEYIRFFVRPSFEFKNYTLTFPESSFSVLHNLPVFYFNLGLSWRLPDRKKCPIGNCRTQINHRHGSNSYRSRAHPFWKWQDPDYGENYRQLIRYKGKNKRKINPY